MRLAYGHRINRHGPIGRGTLTLRADVGDERLPFVTLARTVHLAVVNAIAKARESSSRGSTKRGLTLGVAALPTF